MPVSVVCESSANVNAALRESLGGGNVGSGSCASAAAASAAALDDTKAGSSSANGGGDDVDSLQSKLVASAKRVLLSKIDYEEVNNYSQSVLDSLKSKYIVLKPSTAIATNGENGRASPATAAANNNGNGTSSSAAGTYANGNAIKQRNNSSGANSSCPNELPPPKRILFARENVRIGWKSSQRKWQIGVGMMNVGNTCYLNSTLQALFHVPSMANWLVSDAQHMERCDSADTGCIICAMAKTLHASQSSQSAIRPYFVYSKLKAICKHLVMGRQEDAHEFLRYLVEAMEKSYLMRCRNFKELDQYSKETTPLNQILGGYLRSAVRCLACSHVSVTFQHFQDLLLDIRKADTVEDALEGYFARERLEDMGYKCEACKKKVSATKQFSLERAPIALCIQLKRFSMLGTKINKQISIKTRLDLTKFASRKQPGGSATGGCGGEQLSYKLVAMVTHLGASQHCGHYTAIGLTESGTYYNYDDSYVRPISVQNVCNTNAYIIFYELDVPRVPPSATQVSGAAAEAKENYSKVQQNGYGSPQRIIGPQLPPAGLSGYASASSVLANVGSKLSVNRQSAIPTSSHNGNIQNSKIMNHFKNNNSNSGLKSSVSSSSNATATTSSSGQNGSPANNTNHHNTNTHLQQNGLLTGTGKFQESAHAKSALVGPSNQGQTAAAANGNESSCSDRDEDEVSSSTPMSVKKSAAVSSSLPSMPKLFENSNASGGSFFLSSQQNGKKNIASHPNTTTTASSSSSVTAISAPPTPQLLLPKSPLKSLVPYESESEWDDDETPTTTTTTTTTTVTTTAEPKVNGSCLIKPPLKRRSSASSSSEEDEDSAAKKPTTNGGGIVKAKKKPILTNGNSGISSSCSNSTTSTQSKANNKQKTDAIDEIFNFNPNHHNNNNNKRNANSNSNNNSNNINTPTKKQKPHSQQFHVSSTTTPTSGSDDGDEDNNDSNSLARAPLYRSHSTPPSPPVIKTKTGLWQVTTLQPPLEAGTATPNKNHKNPFSAKTPPTGAEPLFSKRVKLNGAEKSETKRTFAGNGYQRSTSDNGGTNVVSELLKQSHRGYGGPVLTWNGDQTEIEREIKEESREQRQRDWEDEEENEMDRGRQKKVKAHKEPQNPRTPGYNPFQEQDNQRRWKHGGNGGSSHQRFHGGNFRHQFQRNKFKFPRFNQKFQRTHQRNGGGGGGASNGGYNRRDS